MDVGNYSKLENGSHGAPQKEETLQKITKALSLDKEHKEKLFGLAAIANGKIPSDVVEDIKDYEYLPVLLRTIANKQLTDEQLKELTERINKEL